MAFGLNTMNVSEARDITKNSRALAEDYLKDFIYPKIKSSANNGKFSCFFFIGSQERYRHIHVEQKIESAIEILKQSGYNVKLDYNGFSYVPRGLSDDDGNGPKYTSYGLHIDWS